METAILTLNVRGLGNKEKRNQVFEWLRGLNYSIFMLQETHLTKQNIELWKHDWPGRFVYSGSKTNSEGVGIFLHPNSDIELSNFNEIIIGRLITADIKIQDITITLINIYGPNKDDLYILKKNKRILVCEQR
jgi:exonuclease III